MCRARLFGKKLSFMVAADFSFRSTRESQKAHQQWISRYEMSSLPERRTTLRARAWTGPTPDCGGSAEPSSSLQGVACEAAWQASLLRCWQPSKRDRAAKEAIASFLRKRGEAVCELLASVLGGCESSTRHRATPEQRSLQDPLTGGVAVRERVADLSTRKLRESERGTRTIVREAIRVRAGSVEEAGNGF